MIDRLKKFDIFGRDVHFFYKGQAKYHTKCGCFMTFFVVICYVIVVCFKWIEFVGETDSIEYFSEARQDMNERIDFQSLGFSFAIDNLEPRFGKIEAAQVSWNGIGKAVFVE